MKKIASFKVDHTKLKPGLYVSRTDKCEKTYVTTLDIRMRQPNIEPMTMGAMHAIEHLGATFLRNNPVYADKTVYFGPMGCRTGFYAVFFGKYTSVELSEIIKLTFEYIAAFKGDIPGATPEECGNCRDMDLEAAQTDARNYLKVLYSLNKETTEYA